MPKKAAEAGTFGVNKRRRSTMIKKLLLCMVISLFAGLGVTAGAEEAEDECSFLSVFNVKFYVAADQDAGLEGDVKVAFDLTGLFGTLYLPGSADTATS